MIGHALNNGDTLHALMLVAFCLVAAGIVRLRPWRWVLPYLRSGRHG